MTNRRLLIAMSTTVALLMVAGAISFVRYVRSHAPDPRLVAVAPFDIFVPGLEPWRVRLAVGLTAAISAPLAAVSHAPRLEARYEDVERRDGDESRGRRVAAEVEVEDERGGDLA